MRERGSDFLQKYIRPVWLVRFPCALGKEAFATCSRARCRSTSALAMHLRTAHQAWLMSLERSAASHQGRIYKPSQVRHKKPVAQCAQVIRSPSSISKTPSIMIPCVRVRYMRLCPRLADPRFREPAPESKRRDRDYKRQSQVYRPPPFGELRSIFHQARAKRKHPGDEEQNGTHEGKGTKPNGVSHVGTHQC